MTAILAFIINVVVFIAAVATISFIWNLGFKR